MPPATGTALVLLVAFVLPGFVTVLLQERTFKSSDDPTPLDRLLRVLYYSIWCYLLLSFVALKYDIDRQFVQSLYERHEDDLAELVWRGALVILCPAALIWLTTLVWQESGANAWVLEKLRLNARHQQPTAWDYWFHKKYKAHVRVVYPDGRTLWGYYGPESFASYSKDGRDLYLDYSLEEEDDWFGEWDRNNRGVWIRADEAICIEFYDLEDGKEQSAQTSDGPVEAQHRTEPRGSSPAHEEPAQAPPSAPAPETPLEAQDG